MRERIIILVSTCIFKSYLPKMLGINRISLDHSIPKKMYHKEITSRLYQFVLSPIPGPSSIYIPRLLKFPHVVPYVSSNVPLFYGICFPKHSVCSSHGYRFSWVPYLTPNTIFISHILCPKS
jgi:hypothetical protein